MKAGGRLRALLQRLGPIVLAALVFPSCNAQKPDGQEKDRFSSMRSAMVEEQIIKRGVLDARVLAAMRRVPRHLFVPDDIKPMAYDDQALPIGWNQTISQPYIVAVMTEAADLKPGDRVLEIGTGSGYQAAILAELVKDVYTIEIVAPLASRAKETLERLGYKNAHLRSGDGYRGWPEAAPFDAVLLTAAPDHVPQPLIDQLKVGGKLVMPVGKYWQDLVCMTKTESGTVKKELMPVIFVPMTGEAQKKN